ncbi:MAG: hypothetical protein OXR68_05285 [Alphaproteobacteria bacterium]|nr:hypothetical protein [Alphaproteobacteria bacterium]MDD9920017.1 hypothetical protein [Alphaproteobacteria bacterium]
MRIRRHFYIYGIGLGLILSGCSGVLPTTVSDSLSQWESFGEVKNAYDSVETGVTTDEELHKLGFDPQALPNVSILNYVDIVRGFGTVFDRADLPEGVQQCMKVREQCTGLVAHVEDIRQERTGSVAADLFGFRKQTKTEGWTFQATMVLVDNIVVYKMWNGTPRIQKMEKQNTPLGPMQNMSGIIPKPF